MQSYSFDEDKLVRVPVLIGVAGRDLISRALVDTGADCIFIDSIVAEYLGLRKMGSEKVGAAGGALDAIETAMSLSILSSDLKSRISRSDIKAFIIKNLGEDVVLGAEFFIDKCKLHFDYFKLKLEIEGDWD